MRTAQSDDRTSGRFSARSRQGGATPPNPVSCEACGVAGCVGECGAVAGERERTDIGAGLWIVVVGIAFLLCPGCSYTAAANPPPKPPATWPDVAQDALPWTFLCLLAIGWARSIGRNEVRKIVRQELAAERAQVRQ